MLVATLSRPLLHHFHREIHHSQHPVSDGRAAFLMLVSVRPRSLSAYLARHHPPGARVRLRTIERALNGLHWLCQIPRD